jgi:uncharacterized membrane protein YeiB
MFLISNVDILALYAICSFALIPFVRASPGTLIGYGLGIVALSLSVEMGELMPMTPSLEAMRADAIQATKVYSTGTFTEVLAFRWQETWHPNQ